MKIEVALSGEDIGSQLHPSISGVGLVRGEYLLRKINKFTPSTEAQKYITEYLLQTARTVAPRRVWYRIVDMEAVEANTFDGIDIIINEKNTIMGLRGIRRALATPQTFTQELQAVASASRDGANIGLVLPFVSRPSDVRSVLEKMKIENIDLPIAIMIETPAAALDIERFIFGTIQRVVVGFNDLASFTLAADRRSEYFNRYDPAVSELAFRAAKAASRLGIECLAAFDGSVEALGHVQSLGFTGCVVGYDRLAHVLGLAPEHTPGTEDLAAVREKAASRIQRWWATATEPALE